MAWRWAANHYLNHCWLDYHRVYASLGLNELKITPGDAYIHQCIKIPWVSSLGNWGRYKSSNITYLTSLGYYRVHISTVRWRSRLLHGKVKVPKRFTTSHSTCKCATSKILVNCIGKLLPFYVYELMFISSATHLMHVYHWHVFPSAIWSKACLLVHEVLGL